MSSIVVIQARTNSSRLPAKVLLPIAGIPIVVLAAKRACNTGRKVIVATSKIADDDLLAKTVLGYGIQCFRGNLSNTLERMIQAVDDYEDNTIFIRLTADNIFPDGCFIDEMEAYFINNKFEYLGSNGPGSGLPYGMSVEITRLRHLREAYACTYSEHDREHVMPYVIRKFGNNIFKKYKEIGKAHYRCTIDLYEDYISVSRLFLDIDNPINISSLDLIQKLEDAPYQPLEKEPVPQLVFGTAQLGMNYGIANINGQPSSIIAEQMLKKAICNGIKYVDTAHAYGVSEEVIGRSLTHGWFERVGVITKLSPLDHCSNETGYSFVQTCVEASILESCRRLKRSTLDVLMLHRADHMQAWEGAVWERLLYYHERGLIGTLGVSVQNPEELELALDNSAVLFIQMPFNLLDHRWNNLEEKIIEVKQNRDLTIHVRSALLQGLLVRFDKMLWESANIIEYEKIYDWLKYQVAKNKCCNCADLCFRYVRSKTWVDGVVVGMESLDQLIDNIKLFNNPPLASNQVFDIESSRPFLEERSLNPSYWSRIDDSISK